jgi:nucleoside-diphosphate-sugar epimerase
MAEIPAVLMILVVGASGFIGRRLVALMDERGIARVAVSRAAVQDRSAMTAAARGCEAAIMLAGRAHVRGDCAAFMQANRDLPVAVAEAFAAAGGRRFVFVSSIAVNGIATGDRAFSEGDSPAPVDDYGRSKLAGEQALRERCAALGLELVIVRPPLVYGPGAPGNFGRLLRAARRGLPLPLASVRNRRDLIGVDNLADLLLLCARHPAAAGELFLASDGEEISTAALARALYRAAGRRSRLLPAPPAFLRMLGAGRLLGDLRVDSSRARVLLGWHPPLTLAEGLGRSVAP